MMCVVPLIPGRVQQDWLIIVSAIHHMPFWHLCLLSGSPELSMLLHGAMAPVFTTWGEAYHLWWYVALRRRVCASQAGVGFWMTDPKQVRQLAEQLAKAQFAAKRDPHDCALLYIALGKKTLLQVTLCWADDQSRPLYNNLEDC